MSEQPLDNKYIYSLEGTRPILLEMPHSGLGGFYSTDQLPPNIAAKIRFRSPKVRNTVGSGCDSAVPHMSDVFNLRNSYDLSLVFNELARVYCDTNRSKNEISGWALEKENADQHYHGIIWAKTLLTDVDLSLDQESLEAIFKEKSEKTLSEPLTMSEFNTLMEQVYDLHHAKIRYLHQSSIRRHGFCIHLALHSLPAMSVKKVLGGYVMGQKSNRGPFDLEKNTLPDIILIHNNYKSTDKVLVDKVRHAFESAGLIVEDGQGPFLGDIDVTKIYGNPRKGVNVIGIEHVTHETEPKRHLGIPEVNFAKSGEFQKVYRQAVINLLAE